jgi:hypothetical protein
MKLKWVNSYSSEDVFEYFNSFARNTFFELLPLEILTKIIILKEKKELKCLRNLIKNHFSFFINKYAFKYHLSYAYRQYHCIHEYRGTKSLECSSCCRVENSCEDVYIVKFEDDIVFYPEVKLLKFKRSDDENELKNKLKFFINSTGTLIFNLKAREL